MAGRGPAPKPAHLRQRRNQAPTARRFATNEPPIEGVPPLGEEVLVPHWHERTVAWWEAVWASPVAEEYLRCDIAGLHTVAVLLDLYWRDPDPKLAAEIRLQFQRFGLTPLDRARLCR